MNILTKICSSVFGKQGTENLINFHDYFILVNDVDKHFIIISKVKKNLWFEREIILILLKRICH